MSAVLSMPLFTHDTEQSSEPGTDEVGMKVPPHSFLGTGLGEGQLYRHHTSCVGHQRVVMKDKLRERWEESYWQDGIFLRNLEGMQETASD